MPLAETAEAYEVAIYAGGTVRRTLRATTAAARYAAADQIADFGTVPAVLDVGVRQISDVMGPGREMRRSLDV